MRKVYTLPQNRVLLKELVFMGACRGWFGGAARLSL
jgi:hypothetical protein